MPDNCLRQFRSPVGPPPNDESVYGRQTAALTRYGTLWTSFMPQPAMVQIIERASMDPAANTDETGNWVGGEYAETLVADTLHTTHIAIVPRKDREATYERLSWIIHRVAGRDGLSGFGWCAGDLQRCLVHIHRKIEDLAMKGSLDSPEYLRYLMFQKIYHDAKEMAAEVTRRAGGPIRSAGSIDIIRRMPGLYGFVEAGIARFTDRLQAIIDSFESDGATTTLKGAIRDCFTAIRCPGLALHNNVTEQTIRDKVAGPLEVMRN